MTKIISQNIYASFYNRLLTGYSPKKSPNEIMDAVYNVAESTGLFAANDIKVRLQPYQYYRLGEGKKISFMSLDILCRGGIQNKRLLSRNKLPYALRNCCPKFHSCQSTSASLKLLLIVTRPSLILKTLTTTVILDFNHHF